MSKLKNLYQQLILDHSKNPRNFGSLPGANHLCQGKNPVCGEEIEVRLLVGENDLVEDIMFSGSGCSISQASASLMTQIVKGKTKAETIALFEAFQEMLKTSSSEELSPDLVSLLGKLTVFAGVREYPSRVKCAGLAWHVVKGALKHEIEAVTTE